ncbi:MAG TPA: FAD-dependent oxidoreductase [Gemmatimonadales bacterium]|nr:FAD-dependent oxidoreductase [Gemmatimonadales bacterium]
MIASIPELAGSLKGQVILPDSDAYDDTRRVFIGDVDRRPTAIVRAANPSDVARVIEFAARSGVELAVRCGGHSAAGYCTTDSGVVLDLRDLREIDIDVAAQTVWAGGGLSALDLTNATGGDCLAVGFGDTGSVSIGGITLGGGIGFQVRKHGLTVDSMLAAEVVTADRHLHQVDAEREQELFWALRGGGGNFGVVTKFKYSMHDVSRVFGGLVVLPGTPEVIEGFIAAAEAAPEELSAIANIMPAPPMPFLPEHLHGKLVVFGFLVYLGDPSAGARAAAPFRALAIPLADMLKPMAYPEIYPPEDPGYRPKPVQHTMFLERVDEPAARTIVDYLNASDAMLRAAQLRVLGGAMARVPVGATAFAHRQSRICAVLVNFYDGTPEDRAHRQAWVDDFARAMYQGDDGA